MAIRIALAEDAAAIHAIYLPTVLEGVATFETEPPGVAVMRERILARLARYPWLVWEDGGQVLAYAYASRFRERAAYDWIAETSIYVRADAQRRGIARRLYGALLETMRLQGLTQAVGVITLPGEASVRMHETMGFTPAGVWRQSGYKLGRWWDVGVWQKTLQASPERPAPVSRSRRCASRRSCTGCWAAQPCRSDRGAGFGRALVETPGSTAASSSGFGHERGRHAQRAACAKCSEAGKSIQDAATNGPADRMTRRASEGAAGRPADLLYRDGCRRKPPCA